MITDTLTMMLVVSLILSFVVLGIFIWGAKGGQFDDGERMMNGLLYDSPEDLNDAIKKEDKVKKLKEDKAKKSLDKNK